MEKLIPLLNERHNLEWVLWSSKVYWDYLFVKWDKENKFYEENLISKKFWFIKWLVENDKIDRSKVLEEIWSCIKISWLWPHYSFYSALLMILAVSDTPIEDLISYLK
jgi:hypothetical protein